MSSPLSPPIEIIKFMVKALLLIMFTPVGSVVLSSTVAWQ